MRERIVEVIKGELEKRREIVLAYVFGSVAKGPPLRVPILTLPFWFQRRHPILSGTVSD